MLRRLLPHPWLSLMLTFVWLALVNKITLGNVLLGGALGIILPFLTAPYWPGSPRLSSPLRETSNPSSALTNKVGVWMADKDALTCSSVIISGVGCRNLASVRHMNPPASVRMFLGTSVLAASGLRGLSPPSRIRAAL